MKNIEPVKPSGLELLFIYVCPHCGRILQFISPTRPALVTCDNCKKNFPIVPVQEKNIQYIKLMLANGRAAIDSDYI